MERMLRNIVGVKPDVRSDDLKRFVGVLGVFRLLDLTTVQLVQSILDQGHLCPLTISIQATVSDYDHSLRLYPLPTAVGKAI